MSYIPKPEYPRPDRQRGNWQILNGQWDFKLLENGKGDDAPGSYDSKITVPFSWTSPLSGVAKNVKGVGWYRTHAEFDPKGGRVFLCFGAVDYIAAVYVNGKKAATHRGGYNEFDTDVTDLWHAGENEIVVRAEDYRNESQTYGKQGYGDIQGIWQSVWVESRELEYIDSFRFFTKTDGNVRLEVIAKAGDGSKITARFDGREFTDEVRSGVCRMDMKFDNPRLWSPDSPNLYEGEIALGNDVIKTYFGIREIKAENGRIILNGAPIYINGTLDQAFNPKGHFTYPSDKGMRDEAFRLKRLGLNMARIHIKCEEPRKLYWMDKLGVLIMQDMPCFWGEPDQAAREAYEAEWPEEFARDFNHPCIFAWVMFNETWGLFSGKKEAREYAKSTQEWVRGIWKKAKDCDPTRIIEDNSPCNYDHVETDINTWHFYINTYEAVRAHIKKICDSTYLDSEFNYIGGNKQSGAPLMNSECGMVWGVDGSAGDSDIAWQYRYMLNEFRLHDKLNGFIFTELHDVVNEFNGYYRIDDIDKDFGYSGMCRGMRVRDLHSAEFLALDCPPSRTVIGGETVSVPCALSSFTKERGGLTCVWELWHDDEYGRVCDMKGAFSIDGYGEGLTRLSDIRATMPPDDCAAVLSVYLYKNGEIISRNFTTFDVRGEVRKGAVVVPVEYGKSEGFDIRWTALSGEKLCLGGAGEVSYEVPVAGEPNDISIVFEAGAKRVLSKDRGATHDDSEGAFMRGYLVDRGSFPNSYWMTDEDKPVSNIIVEIDGVEIARRALVGDNADARGVLSWHYQKEERKLDEAGSYGELVCLSVPSRLLTGIAAKGKFTLTIKADNGLAVYGRNAGRYGTGLRVNFD